MAVTRITMGADGTNESAVGNLLLPVTSGASGEHWAIYNSTNKAVQVSFNRSGGTIVANYETYREHGDTVVNVDLAVNAAEHINIPARGTLKGTVSDTGTGGGQFGIREVVSEHGTGSLEGNFVWLFVN